MALPSELIGTAGLWLLLAVGALLGRRHIGLNPALVPARFALAAQALHFLEEWAMGFHRLFPPLLGLPPWGSTFFLLFNGSWLTIWLAILVGPDSWRDHYFARVALWFLALAGLANLVVHPALALLVGGYFPGLITAFPLGVAGALLAARLMAGD